LEKSLNILMGLVFYPRGGSAQVVRYLSRALIALGHRVHLVTGSLHDENPQHDARVFFDDLPLTVVDYSDAWRGHREGKDPISSAWAIPFHPSYEDKPGVPDRVFYKVNEEVYPALTRCWETPFQKLGSHFQPDILHLHHLNHMHHAAMATFAEAAKATQLHGTELKMLENMAVLENVGKQKQRQQFWREILEQAARGMDHFFAISSDVRQKASDLLAIDDRAITTIFNGVDVSLFRPRDWSADQKLGFLSEILVKNPQGWDETSAPGSITYSEADLARFSFTPDKGTGRLKPLVLYVGRFLDFKRVPLLIQAVHAVNGMFPEGADGPPYNLLVWGGMPGEWEGEHPYTLTRQLGLTNVFFSGWLPHNVLSEGFNLADLFVAPSYYEPFGQVFLEAMATRLPVIATRSGGPLNFVVDSGPEANGWFCEVDKVTSLAKSIHTALIDPQGRARRGSNALALIRSRYDWLQIARQYLQIYFRLVTEAR